MTVPKVQGLCDSPSLGHEVVGRGWLVEEATEGSLQATIPASLDTQQPRPGLPGLHLGHPKKWPH